MQCGAKETPDNLLLSCPKGGDARKKMKDYLNLNSIVTLNILLHISKGIEATIRFLKETKIATKGWIAKRRDEEEGGGEEEGEGGEGEGEGEGERGEEEERGGIDEEEDQSIGQTLYQEPKPTTPLRSL
jgi:hypothetical protein